MIEIIRNAQLFDYLVDFDHLYQFSKKLEKLNHIESDKRIFWIINVIVSRML